MFKEKLKDVGKRIIGQGAEVDFKQRSQEYAAAMSMPIEEAQQKILFEEVFKEIEDQVRLTGRIDAKSYKKFQGAINHLFSREDQDLFRTDASTPLFRTMAMPPLTRAQYKSMEDQYKSKFDGKTPSHLVLKDSAEAQAAILELMNRFKTDPMMVPTDDIKNILAANPALGADLGKILNLRSQMDKHENYFKKQCNFDKAMEKLKYDSKEILTKKVWKDTYDWITTVGRSLAHPDLENFMRAFSATAKFSMKTVWNGSKLMYRASRAAGSFIKKSI